MTMILAWMDNVTEEAPEMAIDEPEEIEDTGDGSDNDDFSWDDLDDE